MMTIQEQKTAGWYFGISNLGLAPTSPKVLVEKFGEDWKKIRAEYNYELMCQMETDDMYDMALEEIQYWMDKMIKHDSWCIKEWGKRKGAS